MRTPLLAAAFAAAAIVLLRANETHAQDTPRMIPPSPVENPEQAIQRDLTQQVAILSNPNSKPEQREQAAERLVLRQRADAREMLLKILRDPDRPAQLAVAKALSGDARPDPRFIASLLSLMGRDRVATDAAVSALTNYADNLEVLNDLIAFAKNNTQVPGSREAAIRGVGSFVKKDAAGFLISLTNSNEEDPQIRKAATVALTEMTGLQQIGSDIQQWNAWWSTSNNQPERDWEAAQFRNRALHYAQVKRESQRLTDHIKTLLDRDYQRVPESQRTDVTLGWLKDTVPAIRVVGADKVLDEKLVGNRIPPVIIDQLRGMIGDSAVEVRQVVINALREINDVTTADPLLAQLAVETDPDVKIVIASTLARLQQIKSVEAILLLLNGPATRVAEAAAEALSELGEPIRKDSVLTAKVSINLRAKLDLIGDKPGTENLRGFILEALAQLHDASMLRIFSRALDVNDPRNTVKIRIAACRGLGNMVESSDKEQAATDLVSDLRRDPDAAVRLEAVKALGNVGTFHQADALYDQTTSREKDRSVRDAAWKVLTSLFTQPEFTANDLLSYWAEKFKDSPALKNDPNPKRRVEVLQNRIVVLQAARDKLIADARVNPQAAQTLAGVHQNIGETLMALEQWDKAAASFRAAMAYWLVNPGAPATLAQLSEQLMQSLLRSGSYPEAVQFAGDRITANPQEQGDMGYLIRTEVERLMSSPKPTDLKNAATLIDETDKMQPPLKDPYAETLKKRREEIRQRSAASGITPRPDAR